MAGCEKSEPPVFRFNAVEWVKQEKTHLGEGEHFPEEYKTEIGTIMTALFGTPLVVLYRTGRLNYEIARRLVTIGRIGLPNIVAGEDVAPELDCNSARETEARKKQAKRESTFFILFPFY